MFVKKNKFIIGKCYKKRGILKSMLHKLLSCSNSFSSSAIIQVNSENLFGMINNKKQHPFATQPEKDYISFAEKEGFVIQLSKNITNHLIFLR